MSSVEHPVMVSPLSAGFSQLGNGPKDTPPYNTGLL